MNYIGSKYSLLDFIDSTINEVIGNNLTELVFCDIFAGTGIVGRHFKTKVHKVISNDIEFYSYTLNRNYIGNHKKLTDKEEYINKLNNLNGIDNGFIYKQYCLGGGNNRQYFSDENGKKIDAIRTQIENWKYNNIISEDLYYFLSSSFVNNLKHWVRMGVTVKAFLI